MNLREIRTNFAHKSKSNQTENLQHILPQVLKN